MFFVARPLNFFWVILIDHSWWLFWVHVNRNSWIQPLDSATNTTIWKSKALSIDLKEDIIDLNKSGKSTGAISKQFQVPRSTVKTTVCRFKVHGTAVSLPRPENTNYHLLLRDNWSGWSRVDQKSNKKQICSELEAAGRQVSLSTVKCVLCQHELTIVGDNSVWVCHCELLWPYRTYSLSVVSERFHVSFSLSARGWETMSPWRQRSTVQVFLGGKS